MMADLTYTEALDLIRSNVYAAWAMLLSGKRRDGTTIDSVGAGSANVQVKDESDANTAVGYSASSLPMPVTGNIALSGEDHIGQTGGHTFQCKPTITTTGTAYAAGDVVGGELVLANAMRVVGGSGVLQDVHVEDTTNQKANLTILIFNQDPGLTYTDNAAVPTLTNDAAKIVRRVNIAASDYETIGGIAVADVAVSKTVKNAASPSSKDLWAVVAITGGTTPTPTYGANGTSLQITFGFFQD
jgi:hypothetical protein